MLRAQIFRSEAPPRFNMADAALFSPTSLPPSLRSLSPWFKNINDVRGCRETPTSSSINSLDFLCTLSLAHVFVLREKKDENILASLQIFSM